MSAAAHPPAPQRTEYHPEKACHHGSTTAGYDFITGTAIIKLELGTRFIPDFEVNIFAQLLGTTPEYLLQYDVNK